MKVLIVLAVLSAALGHPHTFHSQMGGANTWFQGGSWGSGARSIPKGPTRRQCAEVNCPNVCDNGYKNDTNGCQTCDCVCIELLCTQQICPNGRKRDANGCETCACRSPCNLRPLTGPCRASTTRWFYDREEEGCKRFNYGGCEGNGNNFETRQECENTCPEESENQGTSHPPAPNHLCPAIGCPICPNGTKSVRRDGCIYCICKDGYESQRTTFRPPAPSRLCPEIVCPDCPHDTKSITRDGCDYCVCKECSKIQCRIRCHSGKFKKDEYGCDICECEPIS